MPKKILIVDDSADLLTLNKRALELEGHSVRTAEGGEDALELIKKEGDFDLILLDVFMIDMNGPEFIDHLKLKYPDVAAKVPIVFLTGAEMPRNTIAKGHILKAINLEKFVACVGEYL